MDRRRFIALGGSALVPRVAGASVAGDEVRDAAPLAAASRPNIVMIMADQLRMDCLGAYGNGVVKTPHLDRIAREGVVFKAAYSSTPTCTPARSALMTGLGPWRHGMLGYSNMATNRYPVEKGAAMAGAGYYAVAVGKNHYYPITNPHGYHHMMTDEHCTYWFHKRKDGEAQSYEPRCDYESWFWSQMPDKDPHATGLGWNDRTAKAFVYPEEMHATHWTGTTAVRFLQQYERAEPLFLKVSFIRPHSPYDPPERFLRMYDKAKLPGAEVADWAKKYEPRSSDADDLWHGKLSAEEIRESRQGYYAAISFVDEQVGRILEVLERRKMLDNTLVVFFSDHGDMLGDQNLWRKSYAYEQSAHIPMLMRLPKAMQEHGEGVVVENPVEIRDLLPTFLDTAQASIPESIEGRSLLGLLKTKRQGWREYIELGHNVCYDTTNHWNALTDGKWKYIFHAHDGQEQMFHLAADPNELRDLAGVDEHEATLRMWRQRMVEHLRERGEAWVRDGQLMVRKQGMATSPHFPGYAAPEKVAGWG